jgi:hypothetical protein
MNHNNKFNCVYSIGKRCGTEMILKELKLVRFSSVVGSCCTASIRKFLFFLDSKFDILFNKKYLIYTKDVPKFKELNEEFGNRTLNVMLDDINDWHSATIAHHDMSEPAVIAHFERAVTRFYKLINNNVRTLFVYTGILIMFDECEQLVNKFKDHNNYTNFHIIFCEIQEDIPKIQKMHSNEHMSIYLARHERDLKEILQQYDLTDLITLNEIDSKYLFLHD